MIINLTILVRKAPYLRKKWMLAPTVPKHNSPLWETSDFCKNK